MNIPPIKKSNRKRETLNYNSKKIAEVVFEYLFNGLSQRNIDVEILELDSKSTRGYQSMNILHFIGIRHDFKNFFNGLSVKEVIDILKDKKNNSYEELISILTTIDYVGSAYYSWNVLNLNTAIKNTDKSVFCHNGTAIPLAITRFFKINNLNAGQKKEITLLYNNITYNAYFTKDNYQRVRLYWYSDFSNDLNNAYKDFNEVYPNMIFKYINGNTYKIFLENSYTDTKKLLSKKITITSFNQNHKANTKKISQNKIKNNKIDYIDKARKDKKIGDIGEKYILKYEKEKLIAINKEELSKKVIHISAELGDSEGYDILSYNENGDKIFIEVKSTIDNKQDQFFISANELEFANNHVDNYYIYRLYDINRSPKLTIYTYNDLKQLKLIPTQYFVKSN